MGIKVGQVWQNDKNEKFYIKEVCNRHSINSRVFFVSLQNTDEYFAGEVGSCSYECFMYQTNNLKLIEENFSISEELDLELKIKSKIQDIDYYKTKIKDFQNKIDTIKQDIDKLYEKLKQQYPENDTFIKFQGEYITDEDIEAAGQKVLDERKQRKEETIKNAKEWYEITCPSCGKTYKCTYQDRGTHCYNYITENGIDIIGTIESGELECPNCHEWYKEEKWNFKECDIK